MKSIIDWFKRNRFDGTLLEDMGTVYGVGLTKDRINIQVFKKRIISEKPVVRLGMKVGGFGDVYSKKTDLTSDEAIKLVVLLQKAIENIDKDDF